MLKSAAPRSLSMLAPLSLLLLSALAQASERPFGIELPDGPAGRAWSAAREVDVALAVGPGARDWQEWAAVVRAEAQAVKTDAPRRARLATIALAQGRSDDAWDHFAALAGEPDWMTATLPRLFPGHPEAALGQDSGRSWLQVADGASLSPAFPPPSVRAAEVPLGMGRLERRAIRIQGLHVGAATIDLKLAVEYDGLQVEVEHKGGGAARFSIRLPEPLDFELARTYVDWEPAGEPGQPIPLEVGPDAPSRTVFATLRPRQIAWPMTEPIELSASLREHGLRVLCFANDAGRVEVEDFGRALASLLEAPFELALLETSHAPQPFPGLSIDLTSERERGLKMRGLASLAERRALARRD